MMTRFYQFCQLVVLELFLFFLILCLNFNNFLKFLNVSFYLYQIWLWFFWFHSLPTPLNNFHFIHFFFQNFLILSTHLKQREHLQHMKSSRYEHCYNVAYYTYVICKKCGLDYISATRGPSFSIFSNFFYISKTQKILL